MDSQLTTLDSVLADITREFGARAAGYDRAAAFPFENFARLQALGLLSVTTPEALGGGLPAAFGGGTPSLGDCRKIIAAVARGEPATALVLIMQYLSHRSIAASPNWPAHLRARVQRDAVTSGALINALRVEPDLGTPARGGLPATIGRRVSDGWRLSGRKIFSTGIPGLTWLNVWGRSGEETPMVGFFLVHRDTPGISIVENWDHLGMRASASHEVIFDNVLIPQDHAVDLRAAGDWAARAETDLAWMSVLLGALYDSIAQNARDWLLTFLSERKPSNLGAALSTLPRFQETVGAIDALLFNNDAALGNLTRLVDSGDAPSALASNFVKYSVTNNAIAAVERAIEATGNPGLSRSNPLERHYRDVLCSRIHTPQNDAILINAGKAAFASRERQA